MKTKRLEHKQSYGSLLFRLALFSVFVFVALRYFNSALQSSNHSADPTLLEDESTNEWLSFVQGFYKDQETKLTQSSAYIQTKTKTSRVLGEKTTKLNELISAEFTKLKNALVKSIAEEILKKL